MRPGLPTLAVAVAGLLALVLLVSRARHLYFFGDDWEFLIHRGLTWSDLMRPHNEHWSTVPIIAYRVMFHLFGLNHYLAYALMPIVLHLVAAGLLYALMRRNEVAAWPAAMVTVPFLFLAGDLGENPLWDFQVGFLGSAVCGLVALHFAHGDSRLGLVGVWAFSILGLLFSGMALPMLVYVGAYVLLRRGLLRALVATVPAGLVYLVWYAAYGRDAVSTIPDPTADLIIAFAAYGPTAAWQALLRVPAAGTLAVCGLAAFVLLAQLTGRQRALAMGGMLTLVAAYLALATSRAGLGAVPAGASRYSYFAMLYTLPAFALLLSDVGQRLRDRPAHRLTAAGLLVLALTANGVVQTVTFSDGREGLVAGMRGQVAGTKELIEDHATFVTNRVSMPFNPDFTIDALSQPGVLDAIPDEPGQVGLLDASVHAQVASRVTSADLASPDHLRRNALVGATVQGGCADLTAKPGAWFDIASSDNGLQVLLTSQATAYSVQLIAGGDVSAPRDIAVTPGVPTYLVTTSRVGRLRVNLPPGPLTMCLPPAPSKATG